jgi:hypothetical protein
MPLVLVRTVSQLAQSVKLKKTALASAFLASPLLSPTWMRRRSSTLLMY